MKPTPQQLSAFYRSEQERLGTNHPDLAAARKFCSLHGFHILEPASSPLRQLIDHVAAGGVAEE